MNKIRIYIHHGGRFNEDNLVVKYENETVSVIPEINDVDEVDLFYIRDYYTKLGYDRLPTLYWKMPVFQNLKLALQPLESDKDILEMVEWAKKDGGDAHVYYEHVPSIPELVELLPASQEDIPINHEEPPPLSQEDTTQPLNQDIPPPNHDIPPPQTKTAVEIALEELEILLAEDTEDTCFPEPNVVSGGQPNVVSDSQPNVGSEGQPKMGNEGQHETGNKGQGDMGNEGQPEMGNEEPSHMGNEGQGDMGNEEPSLPKNKRRKQENRKGNIKNIVIEEGSDDEVLGHTKNYNCNEHPDKDSDSWCSEYLKTPNSSDDEETDSKTVYPQFNEGSAYGSVELELTMEFATLESFKQALRDFTIKLGRDIVWIKNDKKRVRACCKSDGCPWEIYCAWSKVTNSYQIKTYQEEHTCCRVFENKQATQQWIAGKLVNKLRKNPSMQHGKIVAHMKEKYGVAIEPSKVYRAVQDAKKLIEGGEHEQYSKLWDYCHELLKSNPGSTVKMDTIPKHNGEVQFDRLYICLAGCKNGFKAGCRPLIGLDGCFLKGYYGGQLLTAVGQDGNNQVWVIAYAVVSVENKDNWKWFLTLLHQDLGDFRKHGWNFISDMQKGLIPALQEVMPGAHHRFCVWHLWHNFSKQWKEKELRVLLWQCARSTTPTEFNENMERLKRKNEKAWEYLSNKPKEAWTKAWFSEWPKVDNITNNICEVFNAMILVARSKPIVNMLEDIQSMIMTNIATNKLKLSGHTFLLPPVQKSRLEYEKEESNKWTPKWSGDDGGNIFEVQLGQTTKKCSVNLCTHTCSCRFWQLTGMPCKHVVAAIAWKKAKPEDYCHAWLTMGAYNEIYNHHVNSVPGRQFWEKTEYNNVVPPLHRKTGGRPKRMRRKDGKGKREETVKGHKMKRKLADFTCSACGGKNHNKKGCPVFPPQAANVGGPEEIDPTQSQPTPTQPTQPTQPKATEAQPENTQPRATRAQTKDTPAQTKATRAQTKDTPAQTKATRAQTKTTPPQTKATRAQTKATPPQTKDTPVQTKATPPLPKPSQPKQTPLNEINPRTPKTKSVQEVLSQLGSTDYSTPPQPNRMGKLPFKRPRLIHEAFATGSASQVHGATTGDAPAAAVGDASDGITFVPNPGFNNPNQDVLDSNM